MIYIRRLTAEAKIPARSTPGSAGFDLVATESVTLMPGSRELVKTGLAMVVPAGWVGLIWPRSGLAVRHGIDVMAGVIDSDYRGEISVLLINHGFHDFRINTGDRIAQILFQPASGEVVEVAELDDTERGAGGFGSTGV